MRECSGSVEEQKREVAEQIWLDYFNRVLYDKGMITEDEWNRMTNRIDARRHVKQEKMKKHTICR